MVHTERAALIDDLAGLTEDQWASPSLCAGWTVHDVAAHLVGNAKTTRLGILSAIVWGEVRLRPARTPTALPASAATPGGPGNVAGGRPDERG